MPMTERSPFCSPDLELKTGFMPKKQRSLTSPLQCHLYWALCHRRCRKAKYYRMQLQLRRNEGVMKIMGIFLITAFCLIGMRGEAKMKTQSIDYKTDDTKMEGYLAFDDKN